MTFRVLVLRGLTHYWRTNAAVVAGVATAVAVLAGALLVGDSVRASLRSLVEMRLGRADRVVMSSGFFREQLATDLAATPIVMVQGFVTGQESGRRVGGVWVYGVDDRFWRFHGVPGITGPGERDAFLSPALARELGAASGEAVLVRVQRPSDIPLESVHGRKDDLGRTLRLIVRSVLAPEALGEFSLRPQQGDVRAVFVPLSRLQSDLEIAGRVNALLTSGSAADVEQLVRTRASPDDLGLRLRTLDARGAIVLESDAGLLDDRQAAAALDALKDTPGEATPVFTYLANTIRDGSKEIPYSLVTAIDLRAIVPGVTARPGARPPIVLNEWAARDLEAAVGDPVTLEYYVWEPPGRLLTRRADFQLAAIVPIAAGDRDMAPSYPGITESPTLEDWDPPFPLDLRRVRPVDEQYWQAYRATPKAFVPLAAGQELWRSQYGSLTSIRIVPPPGLSLTQVADAFASRVRARLDPLAAGIAVRDVRADAIAASRGATDFGEYFIYFSFFLVVSALVLAALFFKLGVEQRAREVGLLRAVGFRGRAVRRLFLAEGLILAAAGSVLGIGGAIAYAWLLMTALRTWWVDAVGTTSLSLHVNPASLAAGALGGVVAALACTWWALRGLDAVSERTLLSGELSVEDAPAAFALRAPASLAEAERRREGPPLRKPLPPEGGSHSSTVVASGFSRKRGTRYLAAAVVLTSLGVALIAAATAGAVAPTGAFFGAGAALLGGCLSLSAFAYRRPPRTFVAGHGWWPVARLGLRNASYRPGRSVLSMAVIASATFILISVDAFRRDEGDAATDRRSGVGGYSVMVESLLPVVYDPATEEGRRQLNLVSLENVAIEPLRLLPGDDASCLNLYQPTNPRILGVRDPFIEQGRFRFQDSLATTAQERANPWLLLHRTEPDGAIPVIADANSMTYVLHLGLGDDFVIQNNGRPVRLRLVAALRDSIFQSELVMAETRFRELFPEQEGYRLLLVDAPDAESTAKELENALGDLGGDAMLTTARLAEFHRVENTYLSTFQTLGGLGLLLGTVGLAAVLLRNVIERRRELALLGAVGYRPRHFLLMVLAENALLLGGGLVAGVVCAMLAIAPAAVERGSRLPLTTAGVLLVFALLVTGLLSSALAAKAATRGPLLTSLRSE
ncbi:MAG TPA: ABC transporter permease [Vicinamibacterales bacterium]